MRGAGGGGGAPRAGAAHPAAEQTLAPATPPPQPSGAPPVSATPHRVPTDIAETDQYPQRRWAFNKLEVNIDQVCWDDTV